MRSRPSHLRACADFRQAVCVPEEVIIVIVQAAGFSCAVRPAAAAAAQSTGRCDNWPPHWSPAAAAEQPPSGQAREDSASRAATGSCERDPAMPLCRQKM